MNLDDIRRQLSDARPAIIGGFIVATMLLGTTVMIYFWRGTSFNVLMRDPATTCVDAPVYLGAISNIGVMMWVATAAICLFTAWTIWRADAEHGDVRFLGWSGIGTLYLGLDDVMLLHERIIWRLTGLSEKVIIAAYVTAFIVYLVRFHAAILRGEYALLGIALFFLGLSVAQDILVPFSGNIKNFFEDAAKLFGIIFWLIFYVRTSATSVRLHCSTRAPSRRTPGTETGRSAS